MRFILATLLLLTTVGSVLAGGVHTTYLWHMHQPIYWPDASLWDSGAYQKAYESIHLKANGGNTYPGSSGSHPFNDLDAIFGNDDRVADYNYYPRNTLAAIGDIPNSGAQVSFAASLIENVQSLADAGWQGGRYPSTWYTGYREAALWTTTAGKPRLDIIGVGAHHAINPLIDPEALRMEIRVHKAARQWRWPDIPSSKGFFPAETCFSERIIPVLVQEGYDWVLVPNIHISRACPDYPFAAQGDNIDPPNPADQINPDGGAYFQMTISRGITTRNAVPMAYKPHFIQHVDPQSGLVYRMIGVPTAQGMSWNEGYGSYGFGDIDQISWASSASDPLLVVFAHDGDNAYSGGYSYFNENVPSFCHQAQSLGHSPTTVEQFLVDHTPAASDVVHVEDGGWVNADGDFGSPQFINWNWPLVNASGQFDIPNGWAEDERNWAIITAAHSYVETAEQIGGPARPDKVFRPQDGGNDLEKAWHYYLAALESGYMYYGASLDMEVKATLACNEAITYAQYVIGSGSQDATGPAIWIPQRLPWNPGGKGMGSLWGYQYLDMDSDFYVWTFVHDPNNVARVSLFIREDNDGVNPLTSNDNETYAGGPGVGAWTELAMNQRDFPADNQFNLPQIELFELPTQIADQYWVRVTGYTDALLDYYVEAEDSFGNIKRSPIQHVYVGMFTPTGVTWEPQNPTFQDVIKITVHDPGQGGWLHWGVNAAGQDWETPHENYWPEGSALFQGSGPAIETPLEGPDDGDYWIEIGPFNDAAQVVNTVDFVIHFTDDTWDNNNGQDYHITISPNTPTPAPSRTATPSPTAPPGATYTPTPPPGATYTPTPGTGTPASYPTDMTLALNAGWFQGGDLLTLYAIVENRSFAAVSCLEWVVLDVFGAYYFYPAWTAEPQGQSLQLAPGGTSSTEILVVQLPQILDPGGPFFFHGLITDEQVTQVLSPWVRVVFGFY